MKPWRILGVLLIVGLSIWPKAGISSPAEGRKTQFIDVDEGRPGFWTDECVFVGGERACVIVKGDHKPIVNVTIEVRDSKGNLVAKDDGKGDLAAVVWYPPEDGVYTIKVFNPNDLKNECFILYR